MTGLFHAPKAGEVCPGCQHETSARDWTCRHCGRILDPFLFGTITPKSLTGADKDAFRAGYEACRNRWSETRSTELGDYRPMPDHENAYRAGWQHAANELEAKDDRKRGRRRGLQLAGSGALLTLIGGSVLAGGTMAAWNLLVLGAGLLNLALGLFALITGTSDACPPDLPRNDAAAPVEPSAPAEAADPLLRIAPAPGIPITWALVALNVLVFVAMLASGVNVFTPTTDALIRWGGDFGPRTTGGQWWRLIASMFLHIGVLHLAFNMFVLLQIGRLLERLFGRTAFALIYFVAGICGGLASLAWDPYRVSAGASGAIFGLYGALLGFLLVQRRRLPQPIVSSLLSGALAFVGYNVTVGLTSQSIDLAAHAGGLAGGLVWGAAFSAAPLVPVFRRSTLRNAVVAASAAVAIPALAAALPRAVDFQAHLQQLRAVETKTIERYNSALQRFREGQITGPQFAATVDSEVLPDWTTEKDALSKLHGLPSRQARAAGRLVRNMELRRDGWLAIATGIRERKPDKMKEAAEKQKEADAEIREIMRDPKRP